MTRVAALLLRLALGALLLIAGALKLRAPAAFSTEITNYQLFPQLAPLVATTLPALELLLGAGLILFPQPWRRAANVAVLVLLGVFSVAVGSAYFRHINIECGCFGSGGSPITGFTLLRNLSLFGAAAALSWLDGTRRWGKPAIEPPG